MSKKVLVIRIGAIGDVVETTGLLRSLKKAGYEIDYLTGKVPAQLLQNDSDINNLFIFVSILSLIGLFFTSSLVSLLL